MDDRLNDEAWGKVAIIGYCPIMSHGKDLVDCQKEKCAWWRQLTGGRPKGQAACAVNDLISHLGTLNSTLPLAIREVVSQLVILNGRFQTLLKDIVKTTEKKGE
jgi:hypothetical protein